MTSTAPRRSCRQSRTAVAAVAVLLVALASPASAHGAIRDSSPAEGAVVTKPPQEVALTLAEPAGPGSTLTVTDGCDREVSGPSDIQRDIYSTAISGGRPGTWKVRMRSVSAVDGHVVKGSFSFKVAGKKDCTRGADAGDDEVSTSSRPPIENVDSDTNFPVLPFALGTLAVIALAVAIRRPWARS